MTISTGHADQGYSSAGGLRISRRRLLHAAGVTGLTVPLIGCDLSTEPDTPQSGASGGGPNPPEAPALSELVEQGDLPPVDERLPEQPMVIDPVESLGRYGGSWTSTTTGGSDTAWWWRTTGYEPLVRVDHENTTPIPNLAESFEVNDDGTEFIFHLRPGVRWSDGEPFTAEDVAFWYNDFLRNPDLSPAGPPSWLVTGDEPAVVEATDEVTLTISFPGGGNGYLLYRLAASDGLASTTMPKHYLSQFHAGYNDAIDDLVQSEGYDSWPELFAFKSGQDTMHTQVGLPVIRPWQQVTELGESERIVFERNPFYWKTDPEGSQLPYLDSVILTVATDPEVMLLQATNGEFTLHSRHFNFPANKPVLAQSQEEGEYFLSELTPGSMNVGIIGLNLTHDDPVKREIFRNRDFRIGLSYAIDREELIEAVYQRTGEPWQAAPRPDCRFYDEEMAKQFTEYDLDLANEHLDQAGYTERDADGFRLDGNGQRIKINFVASTTGGDLEHLLIDVQSIIKSQWAQVGIDMDTQAVERSLFQTRTSNEEQDALMWTGFGGHDLTATIDPRWYVPLTTEQSNYAAKWATWYSSRGAKGERPPEDTERQYELYREALSVPDDNERDEIMREIIQIAKEQFYTIGTVLTPDGFGVVANDFRNVPSPQPDCWPFPNPGQSYPEQYFIESN